VTPDVNAPSDWWTDWKSIDWKVVHSKVRRLQVRIAKAVQEGRWGTVTRLQHILTRSLHARLLAVRRVTTNKGKQTPGVDGVVWKTSWQKVCAVLSLRKLGYQPQPLRRIYIPKKSGKRRPLGIPTMQDRAMQALYKLALEPVAETLADGHSYGFPTLGGGRPWSVLYSPGQERFASLDLGSGYRSLLRQHQPRMDARQRPYGQGRSP
jgi:RNA-directed DNA polymerase